MKGFFLFIAVSWWAWTRLQCQTEQNIPEWENDILSTNELFGSDGMYTSQSFIQPTVENTFIFRVSPVQDRQMLNEFIKRFHYKVGRLGISFRILYTYAHVFDGFAVAMRDPNDIRRIEALSLDFLVEIEPDSKLYIQQTDYTEVDVWSGHEIIDYPRVYMNVPHSETAEYMDGSGVIVALLDQGIQYTEKEFIIPGQICANEDRSGCRVTKIYDFVVHEAMGHYYTVDGDFEPVYDGVAPVYGNHGTAMAGLIGGRSETAPGIAPSVVFHDYRVVDAEGTSTKSRTIAAMVLARQNGADVLSISLGGLESDLGMLRGPFLKPDLRSETIVAVPVGNRGEREFLFQVSDMGQIQGAAVVGSFQNPVFKCYRVELSWRNGVAWGPDQRWQVHPFQSNAFDPFLSSGEFVFVRMRPVVAGDPIALSVFKMYHKMLLILECTSIKVCLNQALRLQDYRKVLGFIFVSSMWLQAELFQQVYKPAGHARNMPESIRSRIQSMSHAQGTIHISHHLLTEYIPSPARSSAFGPTNLFRLSPDVCLIGHGLRMYMGKANGLAQYALGYGTSNSNAIFAGLAALAIKFSQTQGRPMLADHLFARMRNTALPRAYTWPEVQLFPQTEGFAFPVLKQGAGLIQAEAMIKTQVHVTPSHLELKLAGPVDASESAVSVSLSIFNMGDKDVVYQLYHMPAAAMRFYPRGEGHVGERLFAKVAFFASDMPANTNLLLVPKHSHISLLVKLYVDASMPQFTFLNGFLQLLPLTISGNDGEASAYGGPEYVRLSVPYFIFYGDLNQFAVIVRVGDRAAFLTSLNILLVHPQINPDYPLRNPPAFPVYQSRYQIPEFTLLDADRPLISLCLLLPVKYLSFHLFSYTSKVQLGKVTEYKHVPASCGLFLGSPWLKFGKQNAQALPLTPQGWDGYYEALENGTTRLEKVTCGHYRICAKSILHVELPATLSAKYDWCSVGFRAGCRT